MRITTAAYKLEMSITGQQMCFNIICINYATQVGNIIFSIFLFSFLFLRGGLRPALRPSIIFFIIFLQKYAKIPIPTMQKNSIGNNSGSVDNRAVTFVYSRGFYGNGGSNDLTAILVT